MTGNRDEQAPVDENLATQEANELVKVGILQRNCDFLFLTQAGGETRNRLGNI